MAVARESIRTPATPNYATHARKLTEAECLAQTVSMGKGIYRGRRVRHIGVMSSRYPVLVDVVAYEDGTCECIDARCEARQYGHREHNHTKLARAHLLREAQRKTEAEIACPDELLATIDDGSQPIHTPRVGKDQIFRAAR